MGREVDIWLKILQGAEHGRRVFSGPHTVQIDLTDNCDNNCVGCWVHSPFLNSKETFPQGKKELSFKQVKKLITCLAAMGTKEMILAGSGEPFLYPRIREVFELIKNEKMHLNVITNGSLLNEHTAQLLVTAGVDLITVSVWAGSPCVYARIHPGKGEEDLRCLETYLKHLAGYKKQLGVSIPHVKIYNVICSYNYDDIVPMVDFARRVDADSIEFQAVDIIKGKTEELALDNFQKLAVLKQFADIRGREDMVFYGSQDSMPVEKFIDEEFLDFGKLWKNYKQGFVLGRYAGELVCPQGKKGSKEFISYADIHNRTALSIFKYRFKYGTQCDGCSLRGMCFEKDSARDINIDLLNLLGVGIFLKKIFALPHNRISPEINLSTNSDVNSIPCYVGWFYARVLTDGRVIPCCKATEHPLGNIYRKSFPKIWKSAEFREFRVKAKTFSKTDGYFSKINCFKSCDNLGFNWEMEERLKEAKVSGVLPVDKKTDKIIIKAKDFFAGDFNYRYHDFGKDLIIDAGNKRGFAKYKFNVSRAGEFEFWSRYASGAIRCVSVYVDGRLILKKALNSITGWWTSKFLKWNKETNMMLTVGTHILEIISSENIPHIEKFVFLRKGKAPGVLIEKHKNQFLDLFSQYVRKDGLRGVLNKLADNFTLNRIADRYLRVLGVYDAEYGYKGPFHVQIDLTNACNNNCIACWCNSPLLKVPRLSADEKQQYLPLALVKELLDDITAMGATEVYYSGSGEPFMHSQIMEVLEYTKKKNLTCHVNTNFTLLTQDKLDCLMDIGVDFLTVSTWAGTAETYVKTHSNRSKEDFFKIKENLTYLNRRKKDVPCIKLYNVIFNMNYFEIEKMVDFAKETKSESVEFTLVDTMPQATDVLALNAPQLDELREQCIRLRSRLDKGNNIAGVLIFMFDQFLRRISVLSDAREAKYDRNIIDSMPCYIGWLFARIIPNGEVHSCLKAHRIPTGSLYKKRFSEIWNSKQQVYFRKKTLVCEKRDPFFRLIGNDAGVKEAGCYKSCDDIGRNTWMHSRMAMLTIPEKLALKSIAKTLKIARRITPKKENHIMFHSDPVYAGVFHGSKAFVGPEQVVIDPTNRCNLRCISCWLYSPLLKENKPSAEWLKQEIAKDKLIELIDDLSCLGTKRVRFTGGGEPFKYKDLMSVVEYAKKKGLVTAITTNFGLVAKKDIERIIEFGVDELCVSVWGSAAEIYRRVHPGIAEDYFEKLKENLDFLKTIKKSALRVTFANVLMNSNFKDLEGMYEFCRQYRADALYFTLADVFLGETDSVLLNDSEKEQLAAVAAAIKKRSEADNIKLEFFDGFLRRVSKINDAVQKGEYDRFDIDKIPCYAGWIFSRVLADGSVVPCCRGVKKVMGNINKVSFSDIWFSPVYNEFRAKAKYLSKQDAYFREIGCVKECDNFMHNEQTHRRMNFEVKS